MRLPVLGSVVLVVLAGCGGGGRSETSLESGPTVEGFAFTADSEVVEGQPIAVRFTCDGEDVAPALAWEGVPEETAELALVLEDPDAPGGTFTHWLVYGIDSAMTQLPGAEGWTGYGPGAPTEGENDFGDSRYGGPCPPAGEEHRYVFRLLALRAPSGLAPRANRAAFDEAAARHVIAEARVTATYART